MANAWPDDLWSLLGIAPPADDPPGYRAAENDASPELNSFGLTFPGLIPAFAASSPDAIGFNEGPTPPSDNDPQYPDADGPFDDGAIPPYPSPPPFPPLPTPGTTPSEDENWTWTPPPPVPDPKVVPPTRPADGFRLPADVGSRKAATILGGGSTWPPAAPPRLPNVAPTYPWATLGNDGVGVNTRPNTSTSGFNVAVPSNDPPGSRMPAARWARNGLSNATNFTFITPDASDVPPTSLASSNQGLHSSSLGAYPTIPPPRWPTAPATPLQKARDGGNGDDRLLHAINLGIDPQYIIPVQARPPAGIGHNGGPPLRPNTPTPLPTQPSRGGPPQGVPLPSTPPPSTIIPPTGAATAGTLAPPQDNQLAPTDPDLMEKLAVWNQLVRTLNQPSVNDQFLGKGGIRTRVGVRLDPRLGLPAAGKHYYPFYAHLLNGYRGELSLANRVTAALPKEVVIHFGMSAGRQGPDIISISPSGMISVWDSKWRGGNRRISPKDGAHQTDKSLDTLQWEVRRAITEAVKSGRLSPDIAERARENLDARNFDIYTIGTGNAHGGIVQSVRNGEVVGTWRP